MTVIRATCPRCGEVEMSPEAIMLSVRHPAEDASYRFECPTCRDSVEKRADRRIVALLLSAGVDLAERGAQTDRGRGGRHDAEPDPEREIAESHEERVVPAAPPFTWDDLLDFHFMLQDDTLLARAFSGR